MTYEHWLDSTATIKNCDWEDSPSDRFQAAYLRATLQLLFPMPLMAIATVANSIPAYEWEKEKEVTILYNPQNPAESCVCDEDESPIAPAVQCILELAGGL